MAMPMAKGMAGCMVMVMVMVMVMEVKQSKAKQIKDKR